MKLLLVELVALLVVCAGVALLSLPAAMIVFGLAVITAVELRGDPPPKVEK